MHVRNGPNSSMPAPIALSGLDRLLLRVLLAFCTDRGMKTEEEIDREVAPAGVDAEDIEKIRRRFGADFECAGLTVLDVGCGMGDLAISMAREGARVTGIDIDGARIREANRKGSALRSAGSVRFVHCDFLEYEPDERFDRILSLEAFEHIPRPERFLPKMAALLSPGGKILSMFGPTWRSPYGAHMQGFTALPWVHLLFPERVVLSARRLVFRPTDPATRYEEIRGGLNKMTVGRFREHVRRAGLRIERFEVNPQFRATPLRLANKLLTGLPVAGEFFAHTVLCALVRNEPRATGTAAEEKVRR